MNVPSAPLTFPEIYSFYMQETGNYCEILIIFVKGWYAGSGYADVMCFTLVCRLFLFLPFSSFLSEAIECI